MTDLEIDQLKTENILQRVSDIFLGEIMELNSVKRCMAIFRIDLELAQEYINTLKGDPHTFGNTLLDFKKEDLAEFIKKHRDTRQD